MDVELQTYKTKKSGIIIVGLYIFLIVLGQLGYLGKILYFIYSDIIFWKKYFSLFHYSFFAIALIGVYKTDILLSIADMKKNSDKYSKYTIVTSVICMIFMIASAIVISMYGIGESKNEELLNESFEENKYMSLFIACFVGPIAEEMIFRFHIYEWIKRVCKKKYIAIVISATIFALYHYQLEDTFAFSQIISLFPLFISGFGLAFLKEKTSNIICPILMHMALNILASS